MRACAPAQRAWQSAGSVQAASGRAACRRGAAAAAAAAGRSPAGSRGGAAAAAAPRRHQAEPQGERAPREANVPGSFYVDHTCIDCDTCRWMAPSTFSRVGEQSAVTAQPATDEQRQAALQALLACPTFSIHVRDRQPGELKAAQESFPLPIPGCPGVYHTGFAAEASFGATAYFIKRPQGNILVDVPSWTPLLAQRLAALGGVKWIFLTHRDDVGDHAAWASHFGAQRIIHRLEASRRQGTDLCEVQLEGEGPWSLPEDSSSSGGGGGGGGSRTADGEADVQLLFTPGHTAGCVSLLYRPDGGVLLTGDHLAYSQRLGRLTIFRAYNWHSVSQQLDSVAKLRQLPFLTVLPGHGRRAQFGSAEEREEQLAALLAAEGWRG